MTVMVFGIVPFLRPTKNRMSIEISMQSLSGQVSLELSGLIDFDRLSTLWWCQRCRAQRESSCQHRRLYIAARWYFILHISKL